MITEIKKIKHNEIENLIQQSTAEIQDIKNNQLEALLKERSKLISPDIVRNFTWFQKNISKRKEYKEYVETAIKNKARIPVLDEDIAFCESKIAHLEQTIGNANRRIIRYQTINSLDDLDIQSFDEAINLLKQNNKDIILEYGDKILSQLPSIFEDISDFCFISKTETLPISNQILSPSELNQKRNVDILVGETFKTLTINDWRTTVHGTVNSVNQDLQSKYAYFIPFENLNKKRIVSALPCNTFFDSPITIPKGSYIIVPKSEMDEVKINFENSDITIIGYDDESEDSNKILNINKASSILMNNLGYAEQELVSSGWDNSKNLEDYKNITRPILEQECELTYDDIIIPEIKNLSQNKKGGIN